MELDALVRRAGLELATLLPRAIYEPERTVLAERGLPASYMAKRLRNRPPLEQAHFVELLTNRPVYHLCLLTHPHPPEWPSRRAGDAAWRRATRCRAEVAAVRQASPRGPDALRRAAPRATEASGGRCRLALPRGLRPALRFRQKPPSRATPNRQASSSAS